MDLYGSYNKDGFYIKDHKKWDYYANNPSLYSKNKCIAYLYLLIPFLGIILMYMKFEEMGLSAL